MHFVTTVALLCKHDIVNACKSVTVQYKRYILIGTCTNPSSKIGH